jgi:transcription termination factor Rho
MPTQKTSVKDSIPLKAEEGQEITVEDIIGEPVAKPTVTPVSITPPVSERPVTVNIQAGNIGSPARNFSGMVDDRVIPDAGLPTETVSGVLDITQVGHGYLRPERIPSDHDIYISSSQIRRFQLRPGDIIGGQARRPKENERYWGLLKVETINDEPVEKVGTRPWFDQLTPIYPDQMFKLETEKDVMSTRLIDLVSPIGKGQRGLIVSPPKAGKTYLIKDVSSAIAKNYPQAHLMAVLIGERPEEVTDINIHMREITGGKGEVYSSNFDEAPDEQTHIAELALERAKRLVEQGRDVFIVLDSITRLARAYNLAMPTSGRTLTGGFDPAALFPAKHFLGAARNIENGGSLTIIGTALIDTGSRMDDLIYEEFKGTGNMELHLDRRLAERRVFPAFDIQRSGTRQEERLYDKKIYERIVTMRRMIDILSPDERTEVILERLKKTKSNEEFLAALAKG